MKFTLDTEAKTIELLSSVTIKELIQLSNTIKDFDTYTVKGKIQEVEKGLKASIQKSDNDFLNEYIEKQRKRREQEEKQKYPYPWTYPRKDESYGLYVVGIDPYKTETVNTEM